MVHSEQSPSVLRRDWRICKSVVKSKPPKLQHWWNRQEYLEKSWRPEKTWCHSIFSKRLSKKAGLEKHERSEWTRDELKQMDQRSKKLMDHA